MKKFLTLVLLVFLSHTAHALDVPPLRGHVNDYAGLLSPAAVQQLETVLTDFERTESTQIVVLTVPTLAGEDSAGFAIRVAEAWRIGRQKVDNGVILLIAKQERKVRIEVGRGLEGTLTDLVSGRIIRGEISPRLRAGDYDGGVMAGVSALMAVVKGEYKALPRDLHQGKKGAPPFITLAMVLLVACIFLGSISRIFGGLAGAAGIPLIASLALPGLSLLLLAGLGVIGFVVGLVISLVFGGGGRGGGFYGGPFMGGGLGGGSFGGGSGGFSGGGGSFGGGGASGDW